MVGHPALRAPLAAAALLALVAAAPATARASTAPDCGPIKVPAAADVLPVGRTTCPGVRPGALVETPVGFCSLNFLFRGGDGRRYVATAGHCVLGEGPFARDAGERTWSRGRGPVARDAAGRRIGEFAYAILRGPKDFSLIRIDTSVASSPKMCYFGGPTGINSERTGMPILHHFGNGVGVGDAVPARSAVATSMASPDHIYAWGVVVPGDSGSPLTTADGRAVGVIVTTGVHLASATDAGLMGATRLAPQLARAASKLGIRLTLLTAPVET